jgi:uncharacterized protein YhhL (DUF1145 family)
MSNTSLILALKIFIMVSWFGAAAAFLVPETTLFGRLGRLLFVLLAVVHTIECAVFFRMLKRTGRPLGFELLNTFFFGIIHFTEVKAIVDAREDPS